MVTYTSGRCDRRLSHFLSQHTIDLHFNQKNQIFTINWHPTDCRSKVDWKNPKQLFFTPKILFAKVDRKSTDSRPNVRWSIDSRSNHLGQCEVLYNPHHSPPFHVHYLLSFKTPNSLPSHRAPLLQQVDWWPTWVWSTRLSDALSRRCQEERLAAANDRRPNLIVLQQRGQLPSVDTFQIRMFSEPGQCKSTRVPSIM